MLRTFEKQGSATSFLRSAQKKRRSFSKKRRSFFQKRGRFSEKCRRKFLKRRSFLKSSRTLAEKHPPISRLLLVKDYKNSASLSGEDHDALKARSKEAEGCGVHHRGIVPPKGGKRQRWAGGVLARRELFCRRTAEEQLIAHLTQEDSTVISKGKERNGHTDNHSHNGEGAGDPVVVEKRKILVEQRIIVLVGKQFYERLDATIGKFTGYHGEQRRKRECFGWRFDFSGEGDGHATDDQSGYPGCHGDVPVGKVHEEKASDVTQCSQKRTAPKGGTRGIADACETDASDCGKNTVVDDIVGEF